jgi:hypothetical protein
MTFIVKPEFLLKEEQNKVKACYGNYCFDNYASSSYRINFWLSMIASKPIVSILHRLFHHKVIHSKTVENISGVIPKSTFSVKALFFFE